MNNERKLIFFYSTIQTPFKKKYFEENFKQNFHFFEFNEKENLSLHIKKKRVLKFIEKQKKVIISIEDFNFMNEIQKNFKEKFKIFYFKLSKEKLFWINDFLLAESTIEHKDASLLKFFPDSKEEFSKENIFEIEIPIELNKNKKEIINKVSKGKNNLHIYRVYSLIFI